MGPLISKYGFNEDEIDEVARDILNTAIDLGLEQTLILLGLCRAITILASDEELDMAAIMLDEMKELELTDEEYYEEDEDNLEDD